MIGCVILNYNDSKNVVELAKTVISFSIVDKIVVVDNNSHVDDKNNLQILREFKEVELLFLKTNKGYAYGHNRGLEALEKYNPEYAFIFNSDVILNKESLIETLKAIDKDKDLAIVSPLILDCDKKIDRIGGWLFPTYFQCLKYCFFLGRRTNFQTSVINDDSLKQSIIYCDAVRGSFQCFNFEYLKSVNYFDEGTFLYFEENNLGLKINKIGKKEVIITNVTYIHNHPKNRKTKTKRFHQSLLSMKHYLIVSNKLNIFKKLLLNICIFLGTTEHYLIDFAFSFKK